MCYHREHHHSNRLQLNKWPVCIHETRPLLTNLDHLYSTISLSVSEYTTLDSKLVSHCRVALTTDTTQC